MYRQKEIAGNNEHVSCQIMNHELIKNFEIESSIDRSLIHDATSI